MKVTIDLPPGTTEEEIQKALEQVHKSERHKILAAKRRRAVRILVGRHEDELQEILDSLG